MNPAKVTLAPQARLDLRHIKRTISLNSGPRTSLKWVQRLRRAAEGLANAPYKGVMDESLGDRRRWVWRRT